MLYVCGHAEVGRDGNKTNYQAHGIWFAKHGYICLTVDTLQLGEIAAIHHGTFRENRWWWQSRGYTPAGVECWNGIRGIDYLVGRPDVDPERIAVTGISGGGAATYWIAAADPRVKVAVPVSGMADLVAYVPHRAINGHCDCMFLYNIYQWPWTRIAALIAPRPMLVTNSDADRLFPMDGNNRVINRLERVYSLYGASDRVDAMVSIGRHAYRKDIRQAEYRFINTYLKNDPRIVEDSEADLVDKESNRHPIEPRQLRVFPEDSDLPSDQLNTTIDQHFVPLAVVMAPKPGQFEAWKQNLIGQLRRVTFRYFPERIPAAKRVSVSADAAGESRLETEPGIEIGLHLVTDQSAKPPRRIVLLVEGANDEEHAKSAASDVRADDEVYQCFPRGTGDSRWTRNNPPNYVERSLALLGRTADTCRVWDVIATARYLHATYDGKVPVYVGGKGAAGVLAAYAALLEPEIAGVLIRRPPLSHMQPDAPQFLNVLRVCDVPDVLGMLAPRPLAIRGVGPDSLAKTTEAYRSVGASDNLEVRSD